MKLLRTLEAKGLLIHSKAGRAYFYIPVLSFRQASGNHLRELIDLYFDGDSQKMIEWIFVNMVIDEDPVTVENAIVTPQPLVYEANTTRDPGSGNVPVLCAVK
jgi:predicted transcriptional regulator